MAHSPEEIDFEQYYEDWRHRDILTWQIPAVTVVIGSGIMIGSYMAQIPWYVMALAFGLGAFFIATLTVMLAQNLYYQWRDEKHLTDYRKTKTAKPPSRPLPPPVEEEKRLKLCKKEVKTEEFECLFTRLGRIFELRRMGSTLLLLTCFFFYVSLAWLFWSTWQWCGLPYWVGGILVLIFTFSLTFGWFLKWLLKGLDKEIEEYKGQES